jgi:hypothetical protein
MKFPVNIDILNSLFIWIGDTGATGHSLFMDQGGTNFCESKIITHGVVGDEIKTNTEMDLECAYSDEFGNKLYDITLTDTSHLPDSIFNLLSLKRMIQGGWVMHGNVDEITMTKGNQTMRFGIKVLTKKGLLFCIFLKRKGKILGGAAEQSKPIPIAKAHALLGHDSEAITRKIAKELDDWLWIDEALRGLHDRQGKAK